MKLTELEIKGFKSIDGAGQTIAFGDVTILLGANGAGKSNLISFFRMLGYMATASIQVYVGKHGASQLLHYGPKVTDCIEFSVSVCSEGRVETYVIELMWGTHDRLFVSKNSIITTNLLTGEKVESLIGSGEFLEKDGETPIRPPVVDWLSKVRDYQFHDTSDTARIKDRVYIDDAACLRSDAGNLAAFLKNLKNTEKYKPYYQRIVRHVQKVMPQFGDFALDTVPGNERYVRLNWQDKLRPDYLFGPDQISDGSLRFMALATLLMQPPELMPKVIVLDEPELGLHPAATMELAGLIKRASHHVQIIVATQSTRLVDEYSPEQVVVVERDEQSGASQFRRLDTVKLASWLDRYSLSELWEKNVLGGKP
ncbi:AAA family ATPase [Candidatus Thalassolituus haligoni]|uniref:AAA family ATPase n=1 Tax=Candidatus Thalassolituus haligoni TaxID=3100113 RepID=UPI00351750C7